MKPILLPHLPLAARHLPLATILALAILVPACATAPKVHTQTKPGTDYSHYRTFALLPLPATGPVTDPGLMLRIADPARHAVVEALTAKGFTEAQREQADLSVNLRGQSLPKVEVVDMGFHYPAYTRYGRVNVVRNPYTTVENYDERTLTVELLDNHSKDLIWAGWSTANSRSAVSAEQVTNAIHHILTEFPPNPAGSTK